MCLSSQATQEHQKQFDQAQSESNGCNDTDVEIGSHSRVIGVLVHQISDPGLGKLLCLGLDINYQATRLAIWLFPWQQ